jgi:general stress protein 26
MSDDAKIEAKFWKALKSDMTVMIGIEGEGDAQPMTAQLDAEDGAKDPGGPIWFFTAKDTDLAKASAGGKDAMLNFVSKGHDLFASVRGRLIPDNDRDTIDRLWNPFVAAWFEGGKDDPKLQLLRFDPAQAQIWLNEHSLFSGIKLLLGRDPKEDYKDKVAEVRLS